eukprot:1242647-Prymnesium_polylepis.1
MSGSESCHMLRPPPPCIPGKPHHKRPSQLAAPPPSCTCEPCHMACAATSFGGSGGSGGRPSSSSSE